jgi:hypothetical protein
MILSCGSPGTKAMVHTSMSSFLGPGSTIGEGRVFELRCTYGMIVTRFSELKHVRAWHMFSSPRCFGRTIQEDQSSKIYTGSLHGSVL